MRRIFLFLGGIATVVLSFAVTLLVLDYLAPSARDDTRAADIAKIRDAVNKYHSEKGKFPALPGKSASELKSTLVDDGYLQSIPVDPIQGNGPRGYFYYSDGKNYAAILVRLERARGPVAAGSACMTGPYAKGTGAFGEPPACPF